MLTSTVATRYATTTTARVSVLLHEITNATPCDGYSPDAIYRLCYK